MQIVLGIAVIGIAILGMAVGLIFNNRSLKGSCGGNPENCHCTKHEAECKTTPE